MSQTMEIAAAPADEEPQQAGVPGYNPDLARKECWVFLHQLRRVIGTEPEGADLFVKSCKWSDELSYYEVCVRYDDSKQEAIEYAFKAEREMPAFWDDMALKELAEYGIPVREINRDAA